MTPCATAFGAAGDDSTDNSPAATAAVNWIHSTGGTVSWPAGRYRFNSPIPAITAPAGGFTGAGCGNGSELSGDPAAYPHGTVFRSNFASGNLLTFTGARQPVLRDISFWPVVYRSGTSTAELFLNTSTTQGVFENLKFSFCTVPIRVIDAIQNTFRKCSFFSSWGASHVYLGGTAAINTQGVTLDDCVTYQAWQANQPLAATSYTSYANGRTHAVGDVMSCNGTLWQCVQGGATSAAGAGPARPAYTAASGTGSPLSTQLPDGTTKWVMVADANLAGVRMDSWATFLYTRNCHILAGFNGVILQDTANAPGSAPNTWQDSNSVIDHHFGDGAQFQAGQVVDLFGTIFTYSATGRGYTAGNAFVGGLKHVGGRATWNALDGAEVDAGKQYEFIGTDFGGNSQKSAGTRSGLKFGATVTGVSVRGGTFGPLTDANAPGQQRYGIEIVSAATDGFVIEGANLGGNATAGLYNAAGTGPTRVVANCIGA